MASTFKLQELPSLPVWRMFQTTLLGLSSRMPLTWQARYLKDVFSGHPNITSILSQGGRISEDWNASLWSQTEDDSKADRNMGASKQVRVPECLPWSFTEALRVLEVLLSVIPDHGTLLSPSNHTWGHLARREMLSSLFLLHFHFLKTEKGLLTRSCRQRALFLLFKSTSN